MPGRQSEVKWVWGVVLMMLMEAMGLGTKNADSAFSNPNPLKKEG